MKRKNVIVILIIFILLCLCYLYIFFENTELQVSFFNIVSDRIPESFNNFKIIQVSDYHNTKSETLTSELAKEIDYQKPDIIVLTGDLIDSRRTDMDVAINFIKKINHLAPIYFVSGNHEARISDYSKLKDKLLENEVIILDNKTEILKRNDSQINLIGIDDPMMLKTSYKLDSEIINSELISANYDKNNYSILLSHRPELFEVYVDKNVDLVLVGHAHGGQIRIPFIGGLVAPNQGLFPKYTSGIFEENETNMIVSRGIGNSLFPFRINNRPELVVVELNKK